MDNIKIVKGFTTLKIYIDDTLHLLIKRDELIGLQSWVEEGKFLIEYTLKNQSILTEYDEIVKWKKILELIDKDV